MDCDVAVLLNLSPDHLDRYPTYRDYVDAKLRLLDPNKSHGLAEGFKNSLSYANDTQFTNKVNQKYFLFYADDPLQSEFVTNKRQEISRGKLTEQIKRQSYSSHVFSPLSRLVCRPLLLAPRFHLRVPNRDLPV